MKKVHQSIVERGEKGTKVLLNSRLLAMFYRQIIVEITQLNNEGCDKMILNGDIKSRGVLYPWAREVYDPVLNELAELGIEYTSYGNKIEHSLHNAR